MYSKISFIQNSNDILYSLMSSYLMRKYMDGYIFLKKDHILPKSNEMCFTQGKVTYLISIMVGLHRYIHWRLNNEYTVWNVYVYWKVIEH